MPQVEDPDLDEVVVEIINSDELPFIQIEQSDPPRLFIDEGVTTADQVEQYTIKLNVIDQLTDGIGTP